ncbi:MAG: hypothetical protein ACI4V5_00510 [Prevotella sp.]
MDDNRSMNLQLVKKQLSGWEWLFFETPSITKIHYPFDISYAKYDSHPMFRLLTVSEVSVFDDYGCVNASIFNECGKLVRRMFFSPYIVCFPNKENINIEQSKKYIRQKELYESVILELYRLLLSPRGEFVFFNEEHSSKGNDESEKEIDMSRAVFFRSSFSNHYFKESPNIFVFLKKCNFNVDCISASCYIRKHNSNDSNQKRNKGLLSAIGKAVLGNNSKKKNVSIFLSWANIYNSRLKYWHIDLSLPSGDDNIAKVCFKLKNPDAYEYITKKNEHEVTIDDFWNNVKVIKRTSGVFDNVVATIQKRLMIDDYNNNLYGIKNEPINVRDTLEIKFGIKDMAYSQVTGKVITEKGHSHADAYIEQLKSDYKSDFEIFPDIERIDDLTFKITFNIKSRGISAIAHVTYYSEKSYESKYRISVSIKK